MKIGELNSAFESLTLDQQNYAVGFFIAGIEMDACGFSKPVKDTPHAIYAFNDFMKAIARAKEKVPATTKPINPSTN